MESVLMPFLTSMILGRSIDLRTYDIGGDLFNNDLYDEKKLDVFRTTYALLQDNSLPYNLMRLPVDLSLRIKSGTLCSNSGRMGIDGLLRHTTWKQRSAVVVVGTAVQTVRRSLKKDAELLPNWTTRISKSQTHYANAIIYGGWSFILYQYKCDIPGDVEIVRQTLTRELGVSGSLEPHTISMWENALESIKNNHEIRGKVDVNVYTYSTFPFEYKTTSLDGLLDIIGNIPNLVGPVGQPMYMELFPLHNLDASYPVVKENHTLDRKLEEIDGMYDDVKNTKNSLHRWIKQTDTIFSDEDEAKISQLLDHLSVCLKLFNQIATDASIYKTMNGTLLNLAFKLYSSEQSNFAYSYDRIVRRLKESIDAHCEDTFLHKIKGLLHVDVSERIEIGEVEGGLEECKKACTALKQCRSIGYADQLMILMTEENTTPAYYKLILKRKLCYVYFRSSSTSDVFSPTGHSLTGIYDRKCL